MLPRLHSLAPYWAGAALLLLSCFMLFWTYRTGRELGMAEALSKVSPARADFAIATAISRLEYGATGYVVYRPVHELWYSGSVVADARGMRRDLNRGFQNAVGKNLTLGCGPSFPGVCLDDWGDDKGYSDYMILALKVFGYNSQALYNLYFLLMGVSVLLFFVHLFRDTATLFFAPLFLAAHHLAVVLLPDDQVTTVLHDAHFVPAVACLAAIHIAVVLIRREGSLLWSVPFVVGQLGIIALALQSRSSSIWLILFPIAAFVLWLPWRRGMAGILAFGIRRAPIAALVLSVPLLLSTYRNVAYDTIYTSSGITSHLVWHAFYMGFSIHPDAGQRFGFRYADTMVYADAYGYLLAHPELAAGADPEVLRLKRDDSVGGALVKHIGWARYETIVKAMYLRFLAEHPGYAAETYLLYKPKYLLEQILWHQGILDTWPDWVTIEEAHRPVARTSLGFFSLPTLLVVVLACGAVLASGARQRADWWVGLSGLLFVLSLLPSILVAPIHYELPVPFVPLGMLVYAVGAAAAVLVFRYRQRLPVGVARWFSPVRASHYTSRRDEDLSHNGATGGGCAGDGARRVSPTR